jgi:hypothetical protein
VRGIFCDPKARGGGYVQMGWYDRKVRRVRDLSCGDLRQQNQLVLLSQKAAGCFPVESVSRRWSSPAIRGWDGSQRIAE